MQNIITVGLACLLLGCSNVESTFAPNSDDWTGIAGISSNDVMSCIHITNFLGSNDIDSLIEGSLIYGISVPSAKASAAKDLLRADALMQGYRVQFDRSDMVNAAKLNPLVSRLDVASALKMEELGSETALGRFIRSEKLSSLTEKYPYVVLLAVHERKYLATPTTFSTGYDLEIELRTSLQDSADGYRGRFQVYDGGSEVKSLGSNEWIGGMK